jgi:hypothetical protein
MIRWIFTALLLVIKCPGFTEDLQHDLRDWQNEALSRLAQGNMHLFSHEPMHALEDLQWANAHLDTSDASSNPIGFLITFSEVIAYDCLGFHDQCKQAIGSLFITINENNESDGAGFEDQQPVNEKNDDTKFAILFLEHLVFLAPSTEVRELLLSLVEDMAEVLLPAFKFADQTFLENELLSFDYGQEQFSIDNCKSFWKKFRKWCREVGEWLHDVYMICKGINDVRQAYEEWKKNNDEYNVSFHEFKKHYQR